MSMTDPLGDMLTRIRNAQLRKKQHVITPYSKLRAWVTAKAIQNISIVGRLGNTQIPTN